MAWGDYDGDGWLDLLVSGQSNSVPICQIWRNLQNGSFSNINAGLTGVWRSSVAWGDYDNDGKPDVLLAGGSANHPVGGGPTNPFARFGVMWATGSSQIGTPVCPACKGPQWPGRLR